MSLVYEPELTEQIILPWEVVKASITKEDYKRDARWFLEFGGFVDSRRIHHRPGPDFAAKQTSEEVNAGMKRMVEAFRKDPTLPKKMVISFIRKYNEKIAAKEIGTTEVRHRLRPVILTCEMNEILVPWKKLMRLVVQGKTTKEDREYKLEEVRALLSRAWIHLQVPMLIMCSSGVRIGAFDYLKVGNIRPVYRRGGEVVVPDSKDVKFTGGLSSIPQNTQLLCGVMTVYSEETDENYDTLITKEAYAKWVEYIGVRLAEGESVTMDSPAIVTRRRLGRAGSKRWKARSIANAVNDLLWKAGIRTEKKRRHEVQMAHGFRKYYDNIAKDYIAEEYVEKLIGHDTGTKEHYDRHLPKPLVEQYLKAMPFLSIGTAYRAEAELSHKLELVQEERGKEFMDLRLQALEKDSEMKRLERKLAKQESALKEVSGILKQIQSERRKELRSSSE